VPLIKGYADQNTGASFGQACYVVGEVAVDTAGNRARVTMATYVSQSAYSAGKQPIDQAERVVTGSAYFATFEVPLVQSAQSYVAAQPEFSGATIV